MKRLTYKSSVAPMCFVDHTSGNVKEPHELKAQEICIALNKLAAYEDAEEQGLLLRLPCKIGDTVYFIKAFFTIAAVPIEAKVTSICGLDCDNNVIYSAITNGTYRKFDSSDIGKTVFLTKEQAEDALKKIENS